MDIAGGQIEAPTLKDVKSVLVMSDLHLGTANCVLGEVGELERFKALLEHHDVNVDALVLNGDMCDFALATIHNTITEAARFLGLVSQHCKQIVYVPGNHDHHTWLLANEVHELLVKLPRDVEENCAQRTERMYKSSFLKTLVSKNDVDISIAYPNLYWQPPNRPNSTYIFHHGHYCEELYSIISDTLSGAFPNATGSDLEFLEAANFGWLEFVWYQLGQTGKRLGADGLIGHLYEQIREKGPKVLSGGIRRLYDARFKPIVHRALSDFADKEWWLTDKMADIAAGWIDRHAPSTIISAIQAYGAHQKEHTQVGASEWRFRALDEDLAKHCFAYIERTRTSEHVPAGDELSLFFGHTHRAGHLRLVGKPALYNDGGWIRGPNNEWPEAHLFLIDAAGKVTDLQFEPKP